MFGWTAQVFLDVLASQDSSAYIVFDANLANTMTLNQTTCRPRGPFVALGPVRPWIVIADGGVRIDEEFRVLKDTGEAVAGHYAVGSTGRGGLVLEGHGHHLEYAFASGRLCGQRVASDDGDSESVLNRGPAT